MDFEPFPKIPRYTKEVIVTEKIDGTNAQIIVEEDGTIKAASRNRLISVGDDNFGFAAWVEKHKEVLKKYFKPGRYYGEWYGVGIQRGYGMRERKLALFNPRLFGEGFPPELREIGVTVVPVLGIHTHDGDFVGDMMRFLKEEGSQIEPGFMNPEGVIVYHTAAKQLFKQTFEQDGGKYENT